MTIMVLKQGLPTVVAQWNPLRNFFFSVLEPQTMLLHALQDLKVQPKFRSSPKYSTVSPLWLLTLHCSRLVLI